MGADNRIMSRSLNICEHEVIALNIFSFSIPAVMTIYRTFTDKLWQNLLHIAGHSPAPVYTGYCQEKDRECWSGIKVQWISNFGSVINSNFSGPLKARPANCNIPSHLQSFYLGYLYVWSSESWRISSSSKWSQKTKSLNHFKIKAHYNGINQM